MNLATKILLGLGLFGLSLSLAFYFSTYHPADIQQEPFVSPAEAPSLTKGQKVKVLSWNVQFMAGKNYVFFYDPWDGSGPDLRPSPKDISATFDEVARMIRAEDPDIILLQELDEGAARTDGEDQLKRLLKQLPSSYVSHTTAWYWKAAFVPHPQIMGSVGMKLAVISKYRIENAVRYQLPLMPNNLIVTEFQFKRALLEARFPVAGGKPFSAMSIHQDAFAQGSDTMQRQVTLVSKILSEKEAAGDSWIIGGDFNLLPPVRSIYDRLPEAEKPYFQPDSEIARLFDSFSALPSVAMVSGPEASRYFTHWPNTAKAADRTIDYFFLSNQATTENFRVRQEDTGRISDHYPLIVEYVLP